MDTNSLNMDSVNKTLYIPLYGKALVSKKGVILADKKAEEIWDEQTVKLKGKSRSKWLAYYMGMRSAVFDEWVKRKILEDKNAVILHLGCGLDSRVERLGGAKQPWCDIDFETVIAERKRYYQETELYKMICADITDKAFYNTLPLSNHAIVVLEGVSMYLTNEQLKELFNNLSSRFERLSVLVDCYTPFAVKMSKIKNPINEVGVRKVYGVESPKVLENGTALKFKKEHEITPDYLIDGLTGMEKAIFKRLYAGKTSKKLYKLYEYES